MQSTSQLPAEPAHVQRLRPAMGTWVAIEATAQTEGAALSGIDAAYSAVSDIARRLHPSGDGSELVRIRRAAAGTAIGIEAMTWEVLKLAQSVHALSEGIFDPCLPSGAGRLSDLLLSPSGSAPHWAVCRVPLALDLGGIAKGYAIDRAITALRAAGCVTGLVNAGGDLRVYGRTENVLLRYGAHKLLPLTLHDGALAVSDLDADPGQRPPEHQGYYRRSSAPILMRRYAAVLAASAAVADAMTKCVLLAEEHCAARVLRALGARQVG